MLVTCFASVKNILTSPTFKLDIDPPPIEDWLFNLPITPTIEYFEKIYCDPRIQDPPYALGDPYNPALKLINSNCILRASHLNSVQMTDSFIHG
jgi:hypothetical protein